MNISELTKSINAKEKELTQLREQLNKAKKEEEKKTTFKTQLKTLLTPINRLYAQYYDETSAARKVASVLCDPDTFMRVIDSFEKLQPFLDNFDIKDDGTIRLTVNSEKDFDKIVKHFLDDMDW